MTSGAGSSLTYDAKNQPISITIGTATTTMAYDYAGNRVKKAGSTSVTHKYTSGRLSSRL